MFRLLLLIGIVFIPSILRGNDVNHVIAGVMDAPWLGTIEVTRNDYIVVSIVLLLLLMTCIVKNRWIALSAFAAAVLVQFPLFADVAIKSQFYQRLVFSDITKFSGYAVDYLLDFNIKFLVFLVVVLGFGTAFLYYLYTSLRKTNLSPVSASVAGVVLIVTGLMAWQTRATAYVHYRLFENVYSYNSTLAARYRDYTDSFAETQRNPFQEVCTPHPKVTGPVFVLMVESLSSYQSQFFGGHNDWMPNLDRIAADNVALTNFHANGFTTEDGELSLITAEYPIFPPSSVVDKKNRNFSGYWSPDHSLPSAFGAAGYDTAFLTTSDLKFSSTGDWLQSIGFDVVEGSKGSFYDGMPRFHFDAVADEVLVDRLLDYVDTNQDKSLVFAKTVTSHHPHTHPHTGVRNEEAVFRYVDEQIGRLYQELSDRGYFENGHLIIVGDHRAMLPLNREEIDQFGLAKAYARVPAIVVSDQLAPQAKVLAAQFSQVDLSNSLIGLISGTMCTSAVKGAFLGDTVQPPEYIVHRRGDKRHQLNVFSGDRLGTVTLNGDATSFEGAGFDGAEQAKILNFVNYKRIKATKSLR